ncbi:helix-turn-helix transcriptional regulator [Pontibacter sp. SGAir0037]|uniref:helix-turn-helix domain-containing protein n=1 Tax=Pontibacter sp. SGAir0037 TaxID=2571030 RepID=UPI0010CD0199|nr:helix-turn-helix transcriptional regulator [Pontibacter sp. SGAir0037]QCR22351.1 hypothetical protein C1N53_08375 [Pontibacter sp. SGAir0037]
MKEHKYTVVVSTFPVSSIEFDKTYRVRQKRLAMGYTARELSFLLGYHPLYVRNLEDPTSTKKYNAAETNYLRLIFGCPLSELMLGRIEEPFYQVQVEHSFNSASGNKSYTISLLRGNVKEHFLDFEEEPAGFKLSLESTATKQQVQEYVYELFASGYFDEPRTGLEVFNYCVAKLGFPLKPAFVADALGFYTGKRKAPRLVKGRNESSREVFVKALK